MQIDNRLRYSERMAVKTTVKTRVKPYFEEEPEVRELLAEVPLPPGVKLQRIDAGEDYTGDPAMWFIFGVSKRLPLTKKRVRDLVSLKEDVSRRMLGAGLPKWPFVRFIDVK